MDAGRGQDGWYKFIWFYDGNIYSEEKAKLLRRICGLIEEKNEELQ